MKEEQCLEIFERYSRGDRSRYTGIGLGLYLYRQIITAHGGQIGVHSSPGNGIKVNASHQLRVSKLDVNLSTTTLLHLHPLTDILSK
ncbi:sensor histidine kinase [Fortiea sp. LEGE XX443]|uniref:sensor histidine kinase n=1 Tax=Fortiea sp. LEGE XX443 TaxID=1828611 RepID=UPI001880CA65|nr:sensor histidine kinase [Fortiea sp. LEGE XX443]MBE9008313.1 sensor histidine kinase [Fortiea sp. LEGE XX443]